MSNNLDAAKLLDLKQGRRYRVIFEGVFDEVDFDGELFFINDNDDDHQSGVYVNMPGFKVEELESELVDGGIYQDDNGVVFMYRKAINDFLRIGRSISQSFHSPRRPLTRLVPETSAA